MRKYLSDFTLTFAILALILFMVTTPPHFFRNRRGRPNLSLITELSPLCMGSAITSGVLFYVSYKIKGGSLFGRDDEDTEDE
ncbi:MULTISPECIES: hypothetical protein [unclassified Dysgonomonas]|uniref:hypothetical protein n=1 Tax=unclassified Dysgonomonas TaxID=2630389 RepID=UPI0013E9E6F7|nr:MULTISPECIES: hypothetical protein [unclassified Dysgonomonas]